MRSHFNNSSKEPIENTPRLRPIAHGVSGLVLEVDESSVLKIPLGSPRSIEDIKTELEILQRLQQQGYHCAEIVHCLCFNDPRGIVLERLRETLRNRLKTQPPAVIEVWRWAFQAATGLAFIHDHQVLQVDVGCHNMMLDSADNLKLCDFSGSSMDMSKPSVVCDIRSHLPGTTNPTVEGDIFALGSAIYEMVTGHPPYHDKPDYEVWELYAKKEFATEYLAYGDDYETLRCIIVKCWNNNFDDANQIVNILTRPEYNCEQKNKQAPSSTQHAGVHESPLSSNTSSPDKRSQNPKRARKGKAKQTRKRNLLDFLRSWT